MGSDWKSCPLNQFHLSIPPPSFLEIAVSPTILGFLPPFGKFAIQDRPPPVTQSQLRYCSREILWGLWQLRNNVSDDIFINLEITGIRTLLLPPKYSLFYWEILSIVTVLMSKTLLQITLKELRDPLRLEAKSYVPPCALLGILDKDTQCLCMLSSRKLA